MWYEQPVEERIAAMRWYAERARENVEAQKKANLGCSRRHPTYWPEQIAWQENIVIRLEALADEMERTGKVLG